MAVPTTSDERSRDDEGLIDHLRVLAAAAVAYFRARLQLAGLESKEASVHYLKILIWLLIGLIGFVFGYIFFCIAVVFLISHLLHVDWMWVMLAAGVAHFLLAIASALIARSKFAQPMFHATIAEFKKDQTWLTTPRPTTKPN